MLKDILPPDVRKPIYLIYALVGLTLTCTQAGFAAAAVGQPVWLVVAWAVFGVLGTGLGLTAAGNVNPPPEEPRHLAE